MISSSLMIPTCFLLISASLLVASGGMLQTLSGIFSDDEILRMNNFLLHAVIRVQEDQNVCIYVLFLAWGCNKLHPAHAFFHHSFFPFLIATQALDCFVFCSLQYSILCRCCTWGSCNSKKLFFFSCLYQLQWNIALLLIAADAATDQKLFFVFGDSYADTGNLPKSGPYVGSSWLYPYGITWPHYPDGRFCDGKFQTDFFGKKDYNPSPNLQPASFLPSLDIEFFQLYYPVFRRPKDWNPNYIIYSEELITITHVL